MTVKYKTVITKAGAEKLAAATVPNGKKVNFTVMAVGDGGGTLPVPDAGQTKLVNEVWRHALNKISQDNKKLNYVIAELLIPPEAGGFWMREMGLYDDTGTLIAVGNMAESYKPKLEEGSGRAQTVRMVIMVSDIESVELTIDTSTVMATQDYVDDKLAEHEQSRRHPDATLTAKGFTQLSSAIDSASETLAATPKAVKAAYDLANGKYTAQDATTAQKGIVQLSSATDSTSESLAATPKAVKTVSDDVAKLKNSMGTAAGKNVQESRDDTTPGRVLVNGGALALRTVAAAANREIKDASGLPANSVSFCYASAANSPGYEATILDVGGLGGDGYRVQYAASYSDGGKRLKFRTLNADNGYWGAWTSVITNYGGSVDYLDGARYYATKPEYWQGGGAFANQYVNGTAPFFVGGYTTPQGTSVYLPIVKGTSVTSGFGYGASVSFGILRSGNADFGSAIVQIIGDNGDGAIYSFDAKGMFYAPSQLSSGGIISAAGDIVSNGGNLRAGGYVACGANVVAGAGVFESGGNVRVYSSNNPPPRDQYAAPNTAWWSGGLMWWRCGSTGAMRISGVVGSVPNGGRVTFPTAFPNACISVVANQNSNVGSGGTAMQPFDIDRTGFSLRIAGGGTVNLVWMAEGY
ncbi:MULTISPECIES: phage tail protein [unclassified Enterobacter]|uniref:phage tail protein n=1 Tax=unclassified Enterobacter TaxID=2608935 RepID=UPI001EEEC407|nr:MULTISPECIES: phage tail protein [unclassified Enterobacter]MEA3563261.1 phage tail protein [Enterobacter sp. GM-22]MEA3596668.1 phage tail protein [Enterobacter sp. GM-31]